MGFTRAELESFRGQEVDDLLGPNLKLLFVGINPGLWTAAVKTHFAHPGNRFYPALLQAGIIEHPINPATGMTDEDRADLTGRGIGITNLVKRATARASELNANELHEGGERLLDLVAQRRPMVVAVAGITAYRQAFRQPAASLGLQSPPRDKVWSGARLWVVPNPSGLNAHETIATLAVAYAAPAVEAAVIASPD